MGKHDKKTGKGRLDKFYKLAKEQGYRARSAFKLVHLNRKYDFLASSKCCIDLCAAPGGWLQVAEKYMPKGSLIVGVDLNPIKPLQHVSTFVSDITTPQCRQLLRSHLHDWKADLVLHDGAPNVGSAWVQDAFTQNELVLQSLKLATEFLCKGGNFVTKVFRSQDYNALMWVFQQLFKTVEATKPPSSRNVSAEIFVVCQNFIAPKHIDPKFLDPKHVFKDAAPLPPSIILPSAAAAASSAAGPSTSATPALSLSASANAVAKSQSGSHAHANVFMPEKKRRHREGYAEGEFTNFHAATASDFVKGHDAVGLLGMMNKIEFVTEEEKGWLKSRHTTSAVISSCEDLKVLGKSDFKQLMKWRLAIRLEIGLDVKADTAQDATEEVVVEEIDEEEQISEELKKLHEARMTRQKREKKRANEKKNATILKLQLNMTAPEDLDNDDRGLAGEETFDLGEMEREAGRRGKKRAVDDIVADQDGMDASESESEEEESEEEVFDSEEERELRLGALEGELDGMYDDYTQRMAERDAKYKVKQARLKDKNYDAWHGINEEKNGGGSGSDSDVGVSKGWKDQLVRQPRRGDALEDDEEEEEEAGGWELRLAGKARVGESDSDSDSDDEDQPAKKSRKATFGKADEGAAKPQVKGKAEGRKLVRSLVEPEERKQMSRQAQLWFDQNVFKGVGDLAALDGDEEESEEEEDEGMEGDTEEEEDDVDMEAGSTQSSTVDPASAEDDEGDDTFEIVPQAAEDTAPEWDVYDEDQDEVKAATVRAKGLLTAEAVTLATQLVNRQITADQLISDGFNRGSTFNKDGLPEWFLDDESKHYKANLPVTKEAMDALKEKQRALDARPIKKVAEAKARKKFKAHQRLEKAKKKAAGVMETEDLSMGEKAKAVAKAMGRGRGAEKRPEKKVVVARGANKGIAGRPKGVKGRYKMTDPRMRKEVRAMKRIKKKTSKR